MNQLIRTDGTIFWQFLDEQGIEYRQDDFPFLTENAEIKPVLDFETMLGMESASQVIGYLYQKLGKTLSYIGRILDTEFTYGFNDHSDRHTLWIAMQATELLLRSGKNYDGTGIYDNKSEVLAALAGMLHDIGNLVDRKDHSKYSIQLLEQLCVRKNDSHEYEWQKLVEAIRFHEEPVLINQGIKLENLFPLQWALVIADKIHNGRDRVGPKSVNIALSKEPFEHDVHLLVDSMIARSSWHIEIQSFVYQLDFSITEFSHRFTNYLNHKDRLWVPDWVYQEFIDSQKPYRESFKELFLKVYGRRMELASKAVFLLFPWLEAFEVRLSDSDAHDKVGSDLLTIFKAEKP